MFNGMSKEHIRHKCITAVIKIMIISGMDLQIYQFNLSMINCVVTIMIVIYFSIVTEGIFGFMK